MFDICKEATKKFNFSCSGENSCCDRKTVGDVEYLLVGQNMYKTTYFGCKDECIYRRWGTINIHLEEEGT
jgi:hypothetical protein